MVIGFAARGLGSARFAAFARATVPVTYALVWVIHTVVPGAVRRHEQLLVPDVGRSAVVRGVGEQPPVPAGESRRCLILILYTGSFGERRGRTDPLRQRPAVPVRQDDLAVGRDGVDEPIPSPA